MNICATPLSTVQAEALLLKLRETHHELKLGQQLELFRGHDYFFHIFPDFPEISWKNQDFFLKILKKFGKIMKKFGIFGKS